MFLVAIIFKSYTGEKKIASKEARELADETYIYKYPSSGT